MAGPDCRRAECKGNRAGRWKAKCASAARNPRNRLQRREIESCPLNENRELEPRQWRRSSNRRSRKIFGRQTRSRPPRNQAPPTDRHNRKRDRPSRTASCPQAQFSRRDPKSSEPAPKEIGPFSDVWDEQVAEENLRHGQLGRQPAAGKMTPRG